MSAIKIKKQKIKQSIKKDTNDISEIFGNILNPSESNKPNIDIIFKKYSLIRDHYKRYFKLLRVFNNFDFMSLFKHLRSNIDVYIINSDTHAKKLFRPELQFDELYKNMMSYSDLNPEIISELIQEYELLKSSSVISNILVTCKNLTTYRKYISNPSKLSGKFIDTMAGIDFTPFDGIPTFNIQTIYFSDKITESEKEIILFMLYKTYSISHDLYEAYLMPDFDIDMFTTIIQENLGKVRSKIPRCNEAFDKILNSMDLLKGNFNDYYKDYVGSNNPMIIIEQFVKDVSKETTKTVKNSASLTRQFRKIIMYYKNQSKLQRENQTLKKMFDTVDANLAKIESINEQGGIESDDSSDDEPPDNNAEELQKELSKILNLNK